MTTRVYIKTLGCKVNQVESEALAAQLHEQGVECVHAIEDATVVIVNTCTVTAEADTKVRKALRHAARLPQVQTVIATGCAAVLHKEELEALDAKVKVVADKRWIPGQARNDDNGDKGVRGTYKVTPFPVIQSTITSSTVILSEVSAANVVEGPQSSKHLGPSTPSATADSAQDDKGGDTRNDKRVGNAQTHTRVAVKIQDGCENFCSYCIVPYARGVCRSVGAGEVLARVRGLVEAGTKEIVLTGINLGNYANGTLDLVGLIKRLKTETDIYRIRLSSIEPNHVSDELIEYLATSGVLCEHLHIPLQSGSDQVLHAMNRRYTTDDYANLVAKIRAAVPNCALTTDLIVGFPTETDVAFKDTLAFCGDQHFAKAHVFRFSARAGTPAAAFPPLDPPTVAARAQQLRDLTALDALAFKQRFNDTDLEVIVEHVDDQAKRATGTSREYLRFSFAADRYVPGDVARVCYHG